MAYDPSILISSNCYFILINRLLTQMIVNIYSFLLQMYEGTSRKKYRIEHEQMNLIVSPAVLPRKEEALLHVFSKSIIRNKILQIAL